VSENKPPLSKERRQQARRRVLRTLLLTGGVLGAAISGYLPLAYAKKQRLRPPGALDEKDFLASCIKCGQCVQVCPVQAIKLADLVDGFGVGTPFIDAREQACDFSCDAVQCILACPTGSLTYKKPAFLPVRPGAPLATKPVLLAFADSLWMEMPPARFFKSAPALELLDFLERLAPFSAPDRLLKDDTPLFRPPVRKES
jgi:ferredoxin-type protein NapG